MRVGIIGFGKMGRGIFSLVADSPIEATVLVRDPAKADENNRKQEKRLRRAAGTLSPEELEKRMQALRFTADWEELRGCDLIIETIAEDYNVKVEVLRKIEQIVPPHAVISTNSSSFSPTQLAECLQNPARFCGYHFFHPIQLTSVVEIITGPKTSPETVSFLQQVSRDISRTPLLFKDYAGSSINVVLTCMTCEALYILEQGLALPSQIDGIAAKYSRIGACEAVDVVGIPFFTEVLARTLRTFPLQHSMPGINEKLIRDGRFGKYSGAGLYLYKDDRPVDDVREYYMNPEQTHSPRTGAADAASLWERLLYQVFYAVLLLNNLGLGELEDFCLGIRDLIGMTESPLDAMRAIGSERLQATFDRLREEFGPRFDCTPFAHLLPQVDNGR